MSLAALPSSFRPPPLPRRLGKASYFLARGCSPRKALWLANRDAVIANDYRNTGLADLDAAWRASGGWHDLVATGCEVRSKMLALSLGAGTLASRNYGILRALRTRGFGISAAGDFLEIAGEGLRFRATTDEEMSMAREILVERCYELRLAGPCCVLDIGANAGLASLFFAAQPWVDCVLAFEPFGPTADAHAANLALNPELSKKIILHRCGLADADQSLLVPYHRDMSGSMALHGLAPWRGPTAPGHAPVPVAVRRVSSVWSELQPHLRGRTVVAKIDAEGSEFAIIRDLHETGLLRSIDVAVIEWHQQTPDELLQHLGTAGFGLHFRPLSVDATFGIIVAWRMRVG